MAITIVQQPNTFALADGRAFYELNTNNQFSTAGVAHVVDFDFASIPVNDDDFAFSWNGGALDMLFVFKTTPDASGLQLPFGGGTVQAFVDTHLIPALERNEVLYSAFSIASKTNGVRLTARANGVFYNTTTIILGTGASRTTVTAGVDAVERENFSIRALVDVLSNGASTQHVLQVYPYNASVFLHLNKLLNGFYNRLARPAFALTVTQDISAAIIRFRTRFAERFGAVPVTQQLDAGAYKYALPGGASKSFKADGDVNSYINAKYFLTSARSRRVLPTAKLVLNYWHSSPLEELTINFVATKTDGTTANVVFNTKTDCAQFSLWAINCGPQVVADALAIDVADIASYTVRVLDSSGPGLYFSEAYPVAVDTATPKDTTTLLYQNGFGVYEYIDLRGLLTKKTKYSTNSVALFKDDAEKDEAVNHTLAQSVLDSWEFSTGFLTRTEMEQLKELLRSRDVYLVTTAFVPVLVNGGGAELFDTDSGTLNGLTLTLTQEQQEAYL